MTNSLDPLITSLYTRAQEYYVAPTQQAVVAITLDDQPTCPHFFVMGHRLTLSHTVQAPIDATITLTHAALAAILSTPHLFDVRHPMFWAQFSEQFHVSGNTHIAQYFLQLLKRPGATAQALLERSRCQAAHTLDAVTETKQLDAAHVLDAIHTSYPLCIRHALQWDALAWDLDEFAARYGKTLLRRHPHSAQSESLSDFVNALQTAQPNPHNTLRYTGGCLLPTALQHLFPFPLFPDTVFVPAQLWFGRSCGENLATWLHCDIDNSFLAQVYGRKKVRLFSPSQYQLLYPVQTFNSHQPCQVDAAHPDLVHFPLFAQAQPVDVVIEPGDLLIVPTGWYHCVWALEPVLSVSRFMSNEIASLLQKNINILR